MPAPPPTRSPAPEDAVDLASLKRKSVRGGTVTLISRLASVAIHLASTVILARVLSPDDYGAIAMVLALTAIAGLFRDLGLSAAAIQKGVLTHAQMSTLFWLNVAAGAALTSLVAASAPLIALFYGKPELAPLTRLLSLSFLISSFGTQHGALLQREMRFGRKAVPSIAGALAALGISVFLAFRGHGYWALAWGTFAGDITATTLLFLVSPFRPGLPVKGCGVRSMLRFGAHITAFDFLNYFHRNLDNILVGRFWGTDALGLYNRAYRLLMFPITHLRDPINAVAFPAMSRLQNQPDEFRTYFKRVASLLACTSMPLTALLFVSAQPVIELAMGPRWLGVVPIFSTLAVVAFIQPVALLQGLVAMSAGKGRDYLLLGIVHASSSSAGFIAGLPWGPTGVAWGYAVSTYAVLYPGLKIGFRRTSVRMGDFFYSIIRPLIASVAAASIVSLLQPMYGAHPVVRLTATILLFAVAWFLAFVLMPGGLGELGRNMRLFVSWKRQKGGLQPSAARH